MFSFISRVLLFFKGDEDEGSNRVRRVEDAKPRDPKSSNCFSLSRGTNKRASEATEMRNAVEERLVLSGSVAVFVFSLVM